MYFLKMDFKLDDPLFVIINILTLWLFAVSIALMFTIAQCYIPEISKIQSVLSRPLFFISAVFFSMQDVPKESVIINKVSIED